MALYKLISTADGSEVELGIVSSQNWGGAQQTIVYESPGTNAGNVIVTGRTTRTLTLTGKFTVKQGETLADVNDRKIVIENLRDKGIPVKLVAPIDNNEVETYIISDFTGQVVEGVATYIPFTLTLTEFRQANVKQALVNLVSLEPAATFRQRLVERQITPEQAV